MRSLFGRNTSCVYQKKLATDVSSIVPVHEVLPKRPNRVKDEPTVTIVLFALGGVALVLAVLFIIALVVLLFFGPGAKEEYQPVR